MAAWLATQGYPVNRKRVQRLMRLMALVAVYQRPNTSKPAAAHKPYPYLLGGLSIERVNQVWCSDITYIPMAKGFLYLVVIMDWHSRAVLAWRLSNTLGADFCVEALEEAYLHAYVNVAEAKTAIGAWLRFYNEERQHQSHGYRTPRQVYEAQSRWICGRSASPTGFASPASRAGSESGEMLAFAHIPTGTTVTN